MGLKRFFTLIELVVGIVMFSFVVTACGVLMLNLLKGSALPAEVLQSELTFRNNYASLMVKAREACGTKAQFREFFNGAAPGEAHCKVLENKYVQYSLSGGIVVEKEISASETLPENAMLKVVIANGDAGSVVAIFE
ncbi:MAG: hypothetical protein ACRC37_03020 [Lentisphaeria bacterium]